MSLYRSSYPQHANECDINPVISILVYSLGIPQLSDLVAILFLEKLLLETIKIVKYTLSLPHVYVTKNVS